MPDVVVRRTAVVFRVEDVRQRDGPVVVGIQVDGAAECVRVEEREVVRRAPLELDQQSVVLHVAEARERADRAQSGIGFDERTVDVLIGDADDRRRLVQVRLERAVFRARSRVRHLRHVIGAELPLHVDVEVVRVRVAEVDVERRPRRAGRRELRMNSRRRRQAGGQRHVRAEAGPERLRLQKRLILRLR